MEDERSIIYVTATEGPILSICGYCRKIAKETTAIISAPFYDILNPDYNTAPQMLSIPFQPVEYCKCMENMLKGARVDSE